MTAYLEIHLHTRKVFLKSLVFAHLFLFSCVSVNFGPEAPEKSERVSFQSPSPPFSEINDTAADKGWQSSVTGNTIGYTSQCDATSTAELSQVTTRALSGMNQVEELNRESLQYNGRGALDTVTKGELEGVPLRVRLLAFEKNGCVYTLSYIARSGSYEAEASEFQKFVNGFRAR